MHIFTLQIHLIYLIHNVKCFFANFSTFLSVTGRVNHVCETISLMKVFDSYHSYDPKERITPLSVFQKGIQVIKFEESPTSVGLFFSYRRTGLFSTSGQRLLRSIPFAALRLLGLLRSLEERVIIGLYQSRIPPNCVVELTVRLVLLFSTFIR